MKHDRCLGLPPLGTSGVGFTSPVRSCISEFVGVWGTVGAQVRFYRITESVLQARRAGSLRVQSESVGLKQEPRVSRLCSGLSYGGAGSWPYPLHPYASFSA